MRYLTLGEVLELHRRVIKQSGGAAGVRELGGVESAVAQPQMSFGGEGLYPTIEAKATALCFSLVMNHPVVDGNKRIGHAGAGLTSDTSLEVWLPTPRRLLACPLL